MLYPELTRMQASRITWHMLVPPKIRAFLWLVAHNAILTGKTCLRAKAVWRIRYESLVNPSLPMACLWQTASPTLRFAFAMNTRITRINHCRRTFVSEAPYSRKQGLGYPNFSSRVGAAASPRGQLHTGCSLRSNRRPDMILRRLAAAHPRCFCQ